MAGAEILCPACGAKSHSTREIPAGARLKCPQCAHVFQYGAAAAEGPAKSAPAAEPKPDAAPLVEAVPEAHVSETPRVEPAEMPTRSGSRDRAESKSDGVRRTLRRDDDGADRPRSRRDDDGDRDDRPVKRKKRRKGSRGNLLAAIGVFVVIFIMMMGVGGTVVGFALFGAKAKPTIPTIPGGKGGSIRGAASAGWLEDDDPPNLHSPSDQGTDSGPLNANLTSVFQEAPHESGRPRPLMGPLPAQPDKKQVGGPTRTGIAPEILAKVKRATTYVVVGRASGSGFFVAKDVIATNAHVVGMLVPGSELPKSIQVIVNQGQPDEAACTGKLLAWDSENDLALVQVKPADSKVQFPAPLEIVGAPGLYETQSVYAVGYPHGEQIGKAVTVSETTVSSLRQDANGRYERVQVNGGMTHGNSGGPVVNALGQVVGVCVSGIDGTNINFAIPAEHVSEFLAGRLLTLESGELTHEGAAYTLPITVRTTEPLNKFETVAVDWWWGGANDKVAAGRQPPPKDEKHQAAPLKHERAGVYSATVSLGKELVDGKVLWLQAHQRDKDGHEVYYQGLPVHVLPPAEAKPIHLAFHPRKDAPKVAIQTRLMERYGADAGVGSVEYSVNTQLRENLLGEDANNEWVLRYTMDNLDVRESHNGQSLDRVLSIDEHKKYLNKSRLRVQTNSNGQISEVRPAFKDVPSESRDALTKYIELIGRSLQFASVPYPDQEIEPKYSWDSHLSLSLPSSQNRISFPVEVKYTYIGLRMVDGRQVAEFSLGGQITDAEAEVPDGGGGGSNSAGVKIIKEKANIGKVGGYAFVDVKTGIVSRMSIFAESSMTTEFHAQEVSGRDINVKLAGMLEVKLQRQ